MKIKIKKLHHDAKIPTYSHKGDAGMDFYSLEDYSLKPNEIYLFKTGLSMEIPLGYELQIRPRSGLAIKNGISIMNSPGTIDSGYRGDIGIILINHSKDIFNIKKGDKIAQGVLSKYETAEFEVSEELSQTSRGEKGFGSSDIN